MTTTVPMFEATQFLTGADEAPLPRGDGDPDRSLEDAEEEEMAELWAGDPGNQGA